MLKKPALPLETRLMMLRRITADLSDIEVVSHSGLVSEYALRNKVDFLVRGVRSIKDFEEELNLATINRDLAHAQGHRLETVLLPSSPMNAHISSSLVRELATFK
jgi:pantetheine-phosphate adenylyltransferase